MTTRSTSSDTPSTAGPAAAGGPSARRLIALEGMPGAGKTTLAAALTGLGHHVLGEYTAHAPPPAPTTPRCGGPAAASAPETVPLAEHPAVHDDDAHQANWLRKAAQAAHALRTVDGPVFVDRDWLSSLAYAYSIADTDHGRLLRQRGIWARENLAGGRLLLADFYVVFQLGVTPSLRRRTGTLRGAHPWSHPRALKRLQTFYQAPTQIIRRLDPVLGAQLRQATWRSLPGIASTSHALQCVLDYVLPARPEEQDGT